MKNVKKSILGAVAALSLLAAPSNALAAENGTWDYIDTYNMGAGSLNILVVYSGGGDVKFCAPASQEMYFKLKTPDYRLLYHDEYNTTTNCSIFRGVGGAGYYELIHRYAGQPAVSVSYYD